MFITACSLLAFALPQTTGHEPRRLDIEFLYLDLTECTRCVDTGTRLDEALALLAPAMAETGWEARVKKVHVATEEQARALRFSSSPTVRINGRDIQLESRESVCGDCGKLCKDSNVTCREWRFQGKWFTSPPKGVFVEAILTAMTSVPAESSQEAAPFELPDNLKRFFATKKAGTDSKASCCSGGKSEKAGGCCESKEPACTLAAESRDARKQLLKELVAGAVEKRELADGVSFRFQPERDVVARLARVIDLERDCCQFLAFRIRVEEKGGPVWLDVTGPASGKKLIQEYFGPK
jgi:Domain of unknown function (DUF2703)